MVCYAEEHARAHGLLDPDLEPPPFDVPGHTTEEHRAFIEFQEEAGACPTRARDVAPLMLPAPSEGGCSSSEADSLGLLDAIRELPPEEVAASLEANGLPVSEDFETNVTTLAHSMA